MLTFKPETEEEILKSNLIPEGFYKVYVSQALFHTSQEGKVSIKLILIVYDKEGKERTIFSYLSPNYKRLLKHFCDATGLEQHYLSGKLDPLHCERKSCFIKLEIQKNKKGIFQNSVEDFLKEIPEQTLSVSSTGNPKDMDDDIPF